MHAPARPSTETVRLKALHELYVLHTPQEERFDRLTRIAQNALAVPYAYLNLIDEEDQWCKSSADGIQGTTPRDISFCGHTILGHDPLIVRDAHLDERFAQNPLVTKMPNFRAYLGVPLFAEDGSCLGAFCVLDVVPREFPAAEIEIIKDLAAAAQAELNNIVLSKSLEATRLAQANAEAAIESKKNFLAVVSHEIRTPMNGILGMSDILADSKLSPDQRESLDTIRGCTKSLLALINDVLDFSKIEAGKMQLEEIAFDPRASVEHVLALNSQAAATKRVTLGSKFDDAVPPLILGDPMRLGQVLLNLVGNALKFTKTGSVTIEVSNHDLDPDGDPFLKIDVIDTGCGMSPEAQKRVFQAFAQAESSTARDFGGTGLGLVICKEIIELMGGLIRVTSAPGSGSTFTFTMPYPRTQEKLFKPHATARLPDLSAVYKGPPLRILAADDNEVNRRVLDHALRKLGQETHFVENGLEVVAAAKREKFDVILMDFHMPELDGFDATRQIRALPGSNATTPWIIACTADALPGDRQKCLDAGMNDYLTKPLRQEQLRSALAHYAKVRG